MRSRLIDMFRSSSRFDAILNKLSNFQEFIRHFIVLTFFSLNIIHLSNSGFPLKCDAFAIFFF